VRGPGIRPHPRRRRSGAACVAHVRSRGRHRGPILSPRVLGRASRCCASRASTARWRWPPPSTAPDSRRWTST
jgi:hypothetical protein